MEKINYEKEAMKYHQKNELLNHIIDEIEMSIDLIDTLVLNSHNEKREMIEENLEGIENVIAIMKTKIEERKNLTKN